MDEELRNLLLGAAGTIAIWEAASDAMALSDPEGIVLAANPAYYALYGFRPDEVIGKSFAAIFPPDGRAQAEAQYRAVFRGSGEPAGFEAVVRRADGEERVVDARYTFLMRDGRRAAMLSIVRDITERKRLEAQLRDEVETLETLNRTGQRLAAELDLGTLVQAVTDAATALTGAQFGAFFYNLTDERGESYTLYTLSGVPREAFAGFPMPRNTAIFGPTFRGEGPVLLDDVSRDPRYGHHAPYHGMPSGHLPVVSYLAVPVISRGGAVLGGLFFGHPEAGVFTARHERLAVGLAGQAAVAIDNAHLYESTRRAVRARDTFLTTAAHELRTPLTVIKGYVSLLARDLDRTKPEPGPRPGRVAERVGHLRHQVDRLTAIVEDLLDVSQLQEGRLTLRRDRADLAAVARRVLDEQALAPARGARHTLALEADGPVWLDADPGRLEQIVTNLVENAIKYSPEGGTVRCTVRQDNGRAELLVSDQGLGIAPELHAQLFQPFARVAGEERAIGGLGLGLYIVRELVERHGGTIVLSSAAGSGTTVRVSLPLAAAAELATADAP